MSIDVSGWLPNLLGPHTLQAAGVDVTPARPKWNFIGVTIADDSANSRTTFTVSPSTLSGLGTGVATWLATPSSANLAAAVTDETGSGALVFAAAPTLTGTFLFGGARGGVENNALSGSQNNVVVGSVLHVRVTDAGAVTWTGITSNDESGRVLMVTAVGAGGLTLVHESGSSSAANRCRFGGAADLVLAQDETALLVYDLTTKRWRGGKL